MSSGISRTRKKGNPRGLARGALGRVFAFLLIIDEIHSLLAGNIPAEKNPSERGSISRQRFTDSAGRVWGPRMPIRLSCPTSNWRTTSPRPSCPPGKMMETFEQLPAELRINLAASEAVGISRPKNPSAHSQSHGGRFRGASAACWRSPPLKRSAPERSAICLSLLKAGTSSRSRFCLIRIGVSGASGAMKA